MSGDSQRGNCGLLTGHWLYFFFFQAEDGIRDHCVTGVQTCALPISTPTLAVTGSPCAMGVVASSSRSCSAMTTAASAVVSRSEERRVGEEGRSRWSPYH